MPRSLVSASSAVRRKWLARHLALSRLPPLDALRALQDVHDVLWPPGADPARVEWTAETADAIARVLRRAAGEPE